MTANKPTPLVPRLRFPEFRDAPEWEEKKIGDLSEVKASGDLDVAYFSNSQSTTHLYPIYSNAVENAGLYGYYSFPQYKKNSITITARGTLGIAFLRDHEFMGIGRLIVVSDLRNLDPCFLKECWNHLAVIPREVTSIPQLTAIAVRATVLPIPHPAEQQRIAACLSSLDDLIVAEGRKLEALREHKQGLMQQLFPRPGETVPRLRFPEFSEEGAWEETTIGNIGEVITGSTPSTSRRDFYEGDFMFVSPGDISDLRFVEATKTTLTEAGFAECRPIKKNSVLFVCIGSTIGKVAQCSRLCATNQQINSLVASPAFVADFAYYLLDRESVRIARLAGKQAVPIINKSLFATVKVTTPVFDEQQRIADCLSSLDSQLAAQVQKISALKTHKQGLLQQLFPSLETK